MKKERLDNLNRRVNDESVVVNDFMLRIPYWSYQPADYREYPPFSAIRKALDEYLGALFAGEIDDGNGDVLDCIIGDLSRQARIDIDRQRIAHMDVIQSFRMRSASDRAVFEAELQKRKADLAANLEEQAKYRAILKETEFTSGGQKK